MEWTLLANVLSSTVLTPEVQPSIPSDHSQKVSAFPDSFHVLQLIRGVSF